MKGWLLLIAAFLFWPGGSSQNACEKPEDIDFGEIVSTEKAKYLENDQVQYKCNLGYVLEGSERIQCKGQKWTPHAPKCLAPCSITRQQLATKNVFVFGSQRKARVIQSNQSLQFQCNEGYVLVVPSVRKCVDGYIELPLCISERGKNCNAAPRIENGDIITLSAKQYRSGLSVEFRCQKHYAMEGQNRSFCNNGAWTKMPVCLEITCNSPRISNGSFRPQRTIYHDGDLIRIQCDSGFTFEPDNGEKVVECTKNGWSPSPQCVKKSCDTAPEIPNASLEQKDREQYDSGKIINYTCNNGFETKESTKITCRRGQWVGSFTCKDVRCSSPHRIQNGRIIGEIKAKYLPQEKVQYRCNPGYTFVTSSFITCLKKGWTQAPRCSDIGENCGRPPSVENGDIVESHKAIYLQFETVTYQCQSFYTMQGSPRVTCQNGRWSQTPTCRVACTATKEDMREHNIRLKWSNVDKIYSEAGNLVEFECLRGYKRHPNSRSLRVYCVDGKFDYPYCIPISVNEEQNI